MGSESSEVAWPVQCALSCRQVCQQFIRMHTVAEPIQLLLRTLHCRLEIRAAEEADFREAYGGPLTSSKVTGLLPGTNYLFRRALSFHRLP